MEIIAIQGHRREGSGKEEASKLRRQGLIPCIMYKSGGGDATQFSAVPAEFRTLVYTSKFKMAEISLNGKTHKCILKDIQFHPVTDAVIHLDFLELVPGVKFKANIPVRFDGTAPGVKAGGKFLTKMRTVKVMMSPEGIVDELSADISTMDLGGTIRVRDIKDTKGVEILNTGAIPIASIEIPRALRSTK
jgi:large subunit ribosomal protein L25